MVDKSKKKKTELNHWMNYSVKLVNIKKVEILEN